MMEYPKSFAELLRSSPDDAYIGTGFPDANILFVACEPCISSSDDEQYKKEIIGNKKTWIDNLQHNTQLESLTKDAVFNHELNNPLFPYYGQKYIWESINNPNKGGVPRMWYQQQKLIDKIRGVERMKGAEIDFHKYCFSTDLSVAVGKSSKMINPEDRRISIEERLPLFKSNFFSQFPIIIVACGHYIGQTQIKDLSEVFTDSGEKIFQYIGLDKNNDKGWINIHMPLSQKQNSRLLIHTKHFSSSISDRYINRIAELCLEAFPKLRDNSFFA